jgi:hypothetical protein
MPQDQGQQPGEFSILHRQSSKGCRDSPLPHSQRRSRFARQGNGG